ncbi:MAG: N-acetyl-gamma-glutamyl-phosphate reductase [Calditrichaceae bacterium]|nr:N-acetyl-gamma-glutamyl-phosphate reductase [Calditrichaceae bacterium]HES58942.1 N-acetyl-gamma-glutamyl-phosphate reductase [Caldithrix sp.]
MADVTVSIVGASGYTGGELLRLLIFHPEVEIKQVTSERFFGKPIHKVHPNLRKLSNLKFNSLSDLDPCDLLFLCLPHGESMQKIEQYKKLAKKIIDLSADFRLHSAELYEKWYKKPHANPALLKDFIYGIPELHREKMKKTNFVSSAGCNATATILGLYPLYKNDLVELEQTVVEVKVGSSEGGNKFSMASHHPERSGCVRSFSPTSHRHVAEMIQELGMGRDIRIHFSATSIDMVRGVLATSHVFLKKPMEEKEIWKVYRDAYGNEPFIRIVKEREGNYRYPEPKLLSGTNYCDIGFELDPHSNRLVVISAIDNLMKGAAGQAVQAMNLMYGFDETTALQFPGLNPV